MKKLLAAVLALTLMLPLSACGEKNSLAGTWTYTEGDKTITLQLGEDGQGSFSALGDDDGIRWEKADNGVLITFAVDGYTRSEVYTLTPEGTLTGQQGLVLTRTGD